MSPKIRLKNCIVPWSQKTIGEMFTFKNGLNKGKDFFGYGSPIINYTDVYKHRGLTKDMVKGLVSLDADEIRRYKVERGDVFFTRTSETPDEIGLAFVLLDDIEDCSFSGFLLRGRPFTDDLVIEYCKECFSVPSVRNNIVRTCTYTTRALTNGTLLSKIPIPIPPKDEQKAIASFFTNIDALILSIKKKIESLKQMKSASLISMFPQAGETTPRVRFKGFDGEWVNAELWQLFNERIESNINGEMLSVTMNNGIIKASENGRFDNSNSDKSKYKVVKINDIAYNSMRMWQGASGCSSYEGIVSPAYTVVSPNDGVDSNFFAYMFKTDSLIKKFRLHSQGLTSDTWNLKYPAFSKISVLYPKDIKEQQRIASYFKSLDKQISLQEQRLEKLKQIKAACLDKMFV